MVDIIARGLALSVKNNQAIKTYNNSSEFPTIGIDNTIYIDKENNKICYWDNKTNTYIELNNSGGSTGDVTKAVTQIMNESIINGGNASNV